MIDFTGWSLNQGKMSSLEKKKNLYPLSLRAHIYFCTSIYLNLCNKSLNKCIFSLHHFCFQLHIFCELPAFTDFASAKRAPPSSAASSPRFLRTPPHSAATPISARLLMNNYYAFPGVFHPWSDMPKINGYSACLPWSCINLWPKNATLALYQAIKKHYTVFRISPYV